MTDPKGKEVTTTMTALITRLSASVRRDERGQGLAEYALILTFIAVVLVVALAFFGGQINTMLSNVGTSI
jgi:Flp pilus assembly pilin Flp